VFHHIEKHLAEAVSLYVRSQYGVETQVAVEQPKEPRFGELALPVAFQLARQLRRPPKLIGAEIASAIGSFPGVGAFEVAGNGYINVRLDRGVYAASLLGPAPEAPAKAGAEKIIVEHTNINPNKAAHIGHLRNAVLGDTFVRMLRARGRRVEVQNYIDNTGVQVADVVVGFLHLEHVPVEEVVRLSRGDRFDYICWDVYARVGAHYQQHPDHLALRAEALDAIENREGDTAWLAALISDAIAECHLRTMARLGIAYDVLPRESEILYLKFWETAFRLLRERGAIYKETEGKNAKCWVMPGASFREGAGEGDDSKVIVRSNGTVTYVGKDIAYQLWKFGLLGKDFHYRLWKHYLGHDVYITTADPDYAGHSPEFGHGEWVYNVIDSRQSYLQDVVAAGLRQLGFIEQAGRSIHFSYEMVALSPRSCAELGIELSEEDRRRPYVEMSGRRGLGVKADDLIDQLVGQAFAEVASRHPEDAPEKQRAVATDIAVGALRYFLLKFTRNTVIAFDFQEALSFEGETGPYLQYTAVRAGSIFRKLESRGESVPDFAAELTAEAFQRQLACEDFWQLVVAASKADSAIEKAIVSGEPSHVARYAFQLAQMFNNFYHEYPVLTEENRERRIFLLWLTAYLRAQIGRTLAVLGIEVPEYM